MWDNRNKPRLSGETRTVVLKVVGGNNFIDYVPLIWNKMPFPQEILLVPGI